MRFALALSRAKRRCHARGRWSQLTRRASAKGRSIAILPAQSPCRALRAVHSRTDTDQEYFPDPAKRLSVAIGKKSFQPGRNLIHLSRILSIYRPFTLCSVW